MNETKMSLQFVLSMLMLACAIAAGELLLMAGTVIYGAKALRTYRACVVHTRGSRLGAWRRFTSTQRMYWQYVRNPFAVQQMSEAEQWLQRHSGAGASLMEILKRIVAMLTALLVWPIAALVQLVTLAPALVRAWRSNAPRRQAQRMHA